MCNVLSEMASQDGLAKEGLIIPELNFQLIPFIESKHAVVF